MTEHELTPANHDDDREWLNAFEAAMYLRIPVGTLRNWTSNGKLTHYKIGRCVSYKRSELRELLLRNKRGGSYDDKEKRKNR